MAHFQVIESAMHVSRSVTKDQAAYKEFMTQFDNASKTQEGEELSAEKKQEIIRDLVKRVTEGQGCLGGNKETGALSLSKREIIKKGD
jgi:predicted acetyltransferase